MKTKILITAVSTAAMSMMASAAIPDWTLGSQDRDQRAWEMEERQKLTRRNSFKELKKYREEHGMHGTADKNASRYVPNMADIREPGDSSLELERRKTIDTQRKSEQLKRQLESDILKDVSNSTLDFSTLQKATSFWLMPAKDLLKQFNFFKYKDYKEKDKYKEKDNLWEGLRSALPQIKSKEKKYLEFRAPCIVYDVTDVDEAYSAMDALKGLKKLDLDVSSEFRKKSIDVVVSNKGDGVVFVFKWGNE